MFLENVENEWAFDLLYCVAFAVMDKQWLDKNATYMQFNVSRYCFYIVYMIIYIYMYACYADGHDDDD